MHSVSANNNNNDLLTKIKINEEYAKLVPQISQAEYESLKTSIQDNFRWSS